MGELRKAMEEWKADHVYLPGPNEVHPDHQTLCAAGTEAARRYGKLQTLRYYEVGQALLPNFFLDITDLTSRLISASQVFESQLARHNYLAFLKGRWAYRTYTLPREIEAAEAYFCLTVQEIAQSAAVTPFSLPDQDMRKPNALAAHERPLISVIVRSVGDPHLPKTLASIANQSYPKVEVIVVDAKGEEGINIDNPPTRFPLRMVSHGGPLSRPQAANVGLDAIKGAFFAFLDDDDYWYPHHLHSLHEALIDSKSIAAYAPMEWIKPNGEKGRMEAPFVFPLALKDNAVPNHAILFRSEMLDAGLRFDPQLPVYEDWDFLLQARTAGPLARVDDIGGVYRILNRSGVHHESDLRDSCRAYLRRKWGKRLSEMDIFEGILLQELAQLEEQHQREKEELRHTRDRLEGQLKSLTNSRSWRYTRWFRRLFDQLNGEHHA